jgi:hypothetical protein
MGKTIGSRYDQTSEEFRQVGTDWYPVKAKAWVAETVKGTSFTPEQGAAIVAAFSPNTPWDTNLVLAKKFIRGEPVATLGDNIARAERVRDMVDYHGKKVTDPIETLPGKDPERALKITNFHRNIIGDDQAVTVDRWAIRAALDVDSATAAKMLGQKGTYAKVAQAYRLAAQKAGITPAAMQAIVWGQIRGGYD